MCYLLLGLYLAGWLIIMGLVLDIVHSLRANHNKSRDRAFLNPIGPFSFIWLLGRAIGFNPCQNSKELYISLKKLY